MSEKGRFYDDLLALTKHLVSIPSVSPTAGEINIADEIEKNIRAIPYFSQHPDYVITRTLPNDPLGRKMYLLS